MKRIYIKKVTESSFSAKQRRWHSYSTAKQVNCLTDLRSTFNCSPQDRKLLKHLKNMKNIQITLWHDSTIKSLIRFLKKLSQNVETVTLSTVTSKLGGNPTNIQNLYKNLCTLRNLRSLKMLLSFNRQDQGSRNLTEIEYKSINKYIPRMNNLKEFICEESHDGVPGLKRFMSQVQECPKMTGITLVLYESYLGLGQDQNNTIPQMFRLHLFPNLTRLSIYGSVYGNGRISLDPSISEGFKSLVQLKEFTFWTSWQVKNTKFLFEGLSHLPLLDIFYLSVREIENSEETSLIKFLQRQTRLASLKLSIYDKSMRSKMRFEEQNHHLEMMCQSLKDMFRLKDFCINSDLGPLEIISRGLSHVGWTNQLEVLEIASFGCISVPLSPANNNQIKGLCDFIKRQKSSLHSLGIIIGYVKEDEIVDSLIRASGETDKLEVLHLRVNEKIPSHSLEDNKLFQDIPRESLKGYPSFNHTFSCLNQILPRLRELTTLNLSLNPLLFPFDVPMIDSWKIFNSLSSLKNLKSLSLRLPFLKESFMAHPAQVLQELAKLDTLIECLIITARDSDNRIEEIEEALKQCAQKRYFRQNLTF